MNDLVKIDQNTIAKLSTPESIEKISEWAALYFAMEVTTSERSRREQVRDFQLFFDFLFAETGDDAVLSWTPRLSRAFMEYMQHELKNGKRRWSDRTINRVMAHLRTFVRWIHKHRPFPGNRDPMEKIKLLPLNGVLDVERALTASERRRLLDHADYLPVIGGRSKDKRRNKTIPAHERPQRKGYRPWRNRAIVYTLIETGMRRAEITSIDLDHVNVQRNTVLIIQKGNRQRHCQISREGMRAIQDYIEKERSLDADEWKSPALFLPASTVPKSSGRLTPININTVYNEVCRLAGVEGKTPHAARHGMGVHIIKKTGNPRAVQRQLGHTNPSTSMQYMEATPDEMQAVLDER